MNNIDSPAPCREAYFTPELTNIIKGTALILMFVHHFFTFPQWYVAGVSYPGLSGFAEIFCDPFKICVPIFAFLTGYLYFFSSSKSYRYSAKKISDIYINYWLVYIPLLVLALVFGHYQFKLSDFLYELFALKTPIMVFCWYVCFYSAVMLLLPLAVKLIPDGIISSFLIGIIAPSIFFAVLMKGLSNDILLNITGQLRELYPTVISGYLIAKHGLFEKLFDQAFKNNWKGFPKYIVWLALVLGSFIGRYVFASFIFGVIELRGENLSIYVSMDVIYAPCFIYGLVNLARALNEHGAFSRLIGKPLAAIGRQSLLMWFLHCLFFNAASETFQPLLYFPGNPLLVLVWGLAVCYLAALVLSRLADPIIRAKNQLLFK